MLWINVLSKDQVNFGWPASSCYEWITDFFKIFFSNIPSSHIISNWYPRSHKTTNNSHFQITSVIKKYFFLRFSFFFYLSESFLIPWFLFVSWFFYGEKEKMKTVVNIHKMLNLMKSMKFKNDAQKKWTNNCLKIYCSNERDKNRNETNKRMECSEMKWNKCLLSIWAWKSLNYNLEKYTHILH